MAIINTKSHRFDILREFPILSRVLEVSHSDVACDCTSSYHSFEVNAPKSKKTRMIEAPCSHLKNIQRALLDKLLIHKTPHDAAMGFVRGKSIAMNARRHHGHSHLFATDIRSFFHSIKTTHVETMLVKCFSHFSKDLLEEIVGIVMRNGQLPQGAPTSPHLANLVMLPFDEICQSACNTIGAVYTRYADDISISAPNADPLRQLEKVVREGLCVWGMEMHPDKTRHLGPNQTKLVTGLDIGGSRIRPTRSFRKKTAALVRMTENYTGNMERHQDTIRGYLAFWYDVDPADPQLACLLDRMNLPIWAARVRKAEEEQHSRQRDFYSLSQD